MAPFTFLKVLSLAIVLFVAGKIPCTKATPTSTTAASSPSASSFVRRRHLSLRSDVPLPSSLKNSGEHHYDMVEAPLTAQSASVLHPSKRRSLQQQEQQNDITTVFAKLADSTPVILAILLLLGFITACILFILFCIVLPARLLLSCLNCCGSDCADTRKTSRRVYEQDNDIWSCVDDDQSYFTGQETDDNDASNTSAGGRLGDGRIDMTTTTTQATP